MIMRLVAYFDGRYSWTVADWMFKWLLAPMYMFLGFLYALKCDGLLTAAILTLIAVVLWCKAYRRRRVRSATARPAPTIGFRRRDTE